MKLGYSDFIDKHKNVFFIAFIAFFIIYFVVPIVCIDLSKYDNLSVRDNTQFTFAPIYLFVRCCKTSSMIHMEYEQHSYLNVSYQTFFSSVIKNYVDGIISTVFTVLILATIIYLIVRYIKTKSISRLIFIPYCFAILSNISVLITYSVLEPNLALIPINIIITTLFSIPIFLYCLKFNRKLSYKPTDKERISELEQRIAELESEGKDAE